MEISVNWAGLSPDSSGSDMFFTATTGSGHQVSMDGAPTADGQLSGGKNLAPRPMEMVLLGTGGCTAYDVVMILRRARQNIASCEVTLKAERAGTDPKVFTKIHFHFVVRGTKVKPEMVQRAIDLSNEKYCSASVMLGKTAAMTHSFEIIEVSA